MHLMRSARLASDRSLCVQHMDTATVRWRLLTVAQQVLDLLEANNFVEPANLVVPKSERVRHGHWFMHFESEAVALEARHVLDGVPFEATIEHGRGRSAGLAGTLQLDPSQRPDGLRVVLNLDSSEVREHEEWLRGTCGAHGDVEAVVTPLARCQWNPGFAYVTFAAPEHAEAAKRALDGTPSCVPGCDLEMDFAEVKPGVAAYTFKERRDHLLEGRPLPVLDLAHAA